jgi:hypothetical protein
VYRLYRLCSCSRGSLWTYFFRYVYRFYRPCTCSREVYGPTFFVTYRLYRPCKCCRGSLWANFGFPCQSSFHLFLPNHLHYHPRLAQ